MKPIHLVLLGTVVLVSGEAFDIATTAIALLYPAFAGEFEEVGNPFIRLFMYDLGFANNGFLIGVMISLIIDALIIYAAYSRSRSYSSSGSFGSLVLFMVLLGIGHWVAGYQNLTLLQSYAPFGV